MGTERKSQDPFPTLQELEPKEYIFGLEDKPTDLKSRKQSDKSGHRERLRTRVLSRGADSLADYEILEMLLFAASPRGDTKPLAKALIAEFGSLAKVLKADPISLSKIDKAGDAVIATLKMAELLGQKLLRSNVENKNLLGSSQALEDYCIGTMGDKNIEHFRVLFLNNKNRLIADEVQQTGTVNHTAVYPREVVKRALELGSMALILVHNHPSGETDPSAADIEMTREIVTAAAALKIKVHDHLIVGGSKSTSMKALGLI